MGNGGSGTTASHIVCDFNKGVSANLVKKLKVMCLNDNMPSISAIANDISYDAIFEEQLKNFLSPGDIVIGISVSGNSKNIIKAIDYANNNGATTIGFCGFDGGKLKKIAKYPIHVKVDDMKITEDIHSVISHILMKMLSKVLIKQKS
jgi:D-sedoheptulose 7-phosphate isomerase